MNAMPHHPRSAAATFEPGGPPPPAGAADDDGAHPDGFDAADAADAPDAFSGPGAAAPEDAPQPAAARLLPALDDRQVAAWIEAIVEHDERALSALYDATLHRVWGLAQRIVRHHQVVEEVVEDTYFQVWRQAARFDPARGGALAWVLGMARSRAIDALRREARFQHDSLDADDAVPPADGTAAPADELLASARGHAELHAALLALEARPRQLVALAFFRGLSHEEIADQTTLPLGTVKSCIRRALITLRQRLGDAASTALAS